MKELKLESRIGKIPHNEQKVFEKLSDLSFLQTLPLPKEIDSIESDRDNCYITVKGKQLQLKILEREEFKTIKFGGEESNMSFIMWIQIKQIAEDDTRFKLTLKAKMNMFLRSMAEKPLRLFVEKLADALEKIQY